MYSGLDLLTPTIQVRGGETGREENVFQVVGFFLHCLAFDTLKVLASERQREDGRTK